MTSEQIAGLRKRADLNPDSITEPMVSNVELLRLLDEREALLAALKDAAVKLGDARSTLSHCWASETPPDHESVAEADAAEDAARAAIAKAEAP